jgi:hypothetical protein
MLGCWPVTGTGQGMGRPKAPFKSLPSTTIPLSNSQNCPLPILTHCVYTWMVEVWPPPPITLTTSMHTILFPNPLLSFVSLTTLHILQWAQAISKCLPPLIMPLCLFHATTPPVLATILSPTLIAKHHHC